MNNIIQSITNNLNLKDGIFFPNNSYDDYKISYPEESHDYYLDIEENSFWFQHRNKCIYSLISHFSPNEIFFDIGGGNGFTSLYLTQNHIKSVVIEPGLSGAINAKKRGLTTICSRIEDLGFNQESIKSVGLFDVIEHLADERPFLNTLKNYLANDAFLYVTVPAYDFLWSYEDQSSGHFRRYTVKSLTHILEELGFSIKYASYYFSPLVLPIFLLRTLPHKLNKNRKPNINTNKSEHSNTKISSKIISPLLNLELKLIDKLETLPLGASILAVAQYKGN